MHCWTSIGLELCGVELVEQKQPSKRPQSNSAFSACLALRVVAKGACCDIVFDRIMQGCKCMSKVFSSTIVGEAVLCTMQADQIDNI